MVLVIVFASFIEIKAQEKQPNDLRMDVERYLRVSISLSSPYDLLRLGQSGWLDHPVIDANRVIIDVRESDLKSLLSMGFHCDTLMTDVARYYEERSHQELMRLKEIGSRAFLEETQTQIPQLQTYSHPARFRLGTIGGFLSTNDVGAELDEMRRLYPETISPKRTLGNSIQGFPIWYVEVGRNLPQDAPEVLYTGMHHAREPGSMMALIYFLWWLLENEAVNAEASALLASRRIVVVPILNPDGYNHNIASFPNGGGMWRKNRRINPNTSVGVDLNRNYGPWEFWNSPFGGSSTVGSNDTFRGSEPFSEPETRALRDFMMNRRFNAALNYHSFSNLLIYPYGSIRQETPDSAYFRRYARRMTEFNNYLAGTDMQTVGYSTRGTSDDWMYGDSLTKPKVFAMTPEVGLPSDGFWPLPSRIAGHCNENLFPNLFLAWVAGPYLEPSIDPFSVMKGERRGISLTLSNLGLAKSQRNTIRLVSTHPSILIHRAESEISGIDERSERKQTLFDFEIAANAPEGTVPFSIEVVQDGGYTLSFPFSLQVEGTLAVSKEKGRRNDFSLSQNYPNPFNPSTTIRFTLPKAGWYRVVLCDVLGRDLGVITEGIGDIGLNSIVFDASRVALGSGIYFYRLESAAGRLTKKMTLIK